MQAKNKYLIYFIYSLNYFIRKLRKPVSIFKQMFGGRVKDYILETYASEEIYFFCQEANTSKENNNNNNKYRQL
jgi:hypothetical protein